MDIPDPPAPRRKRKPAKLPDPIEIEVVQDDADWDEGEIPEPEPESGWSPRDRDRTRALLAELAQRNREALKLFRGLPEQERFFASHAPERIALGGNRGGKTTAVMVEIARAVTGQDPHDKYPKRDGKAYLVGLDLEHCAEVFYAKLFKPGAFKIIKDLVTLEWRLYNPNDPSDFARPLEVKKAPPLIPRRFYDPKRIAWDDKKKEVPKKVVLNNGWKLNFFSSKGAPPNGVNIDLGAFDEEIVHPGWYPEISARLLDNQITDPETGRTRSGKFMWSATPQAGTQQLYDLKSRADEALEAERDAVAKGQVPPLRTIEAFQFGMLDNDYISARTKDEFVRKFSDNPEEIEVRVHGKFALTGFRVYPEFQPHGAHRCEAFPIPSDWTRYAAVDPGRQVCAALFCAVVPPHHVPSAETGWLVPGQKVVFDELYIRRSNSPIFAREFRDKIGDQVFQAFYIDGMNGRQTSQQTGRTNEDHFRRALKRLKVESETTGSGFIRGNPDVKSGITAVHNGLHLNGARSEWVFMAERLPNFLWEIERYAYIRKPGGYVTDDPNKKNDHLMDCLRYLASAMLRWVKPSRRSKSRPDSVAVRLAEKKRRMAMQGNGKDSGSIKIG